ncbi:Molybdenum cofactor guanylyltransferase [compost metagenome]
MEISGIILAGGRSSRMGSNKALLPLAGDPLIKRLTKELEAAVDHIVIAGGNHNVYGHLGAEVVPDIFPGKGPLSGIHAGMSASPALWSLVVACDMPFADLRVFRRLAELAIEAEAKQSEERIEAIVPQIEGRIHPLLAVYRHSALSALSKELAHGHLKVTKWVESLRVKYVDGLLLSANTGISTEMLQFNMNIPDDYLYAKVKLNSPD